MKIFYVVLNNVQTLNAFFSKLCFRSRRCTKFLY